MIVVTGATGRTGSEVVRALLDKGQAVRAFVRDPDKAQRLFGDGATLAVGDFADPVSVQTAFDGAEQVFLSCADDPRRVEWESAAIDVAAASGVRRIVKLSSIEAEPGSPVAFWDWHGRVERHLRASTVPAVVLRSNFFMSNCSPPPNRSPRRAVSTPPPARRGSPWSTRATSAPQRQPSSSRRATTT